VPRLILAVINPDNTPHGYNWTFAFPMLLFIVIGAVLYLLFSRPHRRVPARMISLPARSAAVPSPDVARSASVAGGLSVAPGGGTVESHLEPGGVNQAAASTAQQDTWQSGGEPGGATAITPPEDAQGSTAEESGPEDSAKDSE
jgi:hypothetical protein